MSEFATFDEDKAVKDISDAITAEIVSLTGLARRREKLTRSYKRNPEYRGGGMALYDETNSRRINRMRNASLLLEHAQMELKQIIMPD